MQWRHPKRLLMSSAAGGRRQPASRHQSCNKQRVSVAIFIPAIGSWTSAEDIVSSLESSQANLPELVTDRSVACYVADACSMFATSLVSTHTSATKPHSTCVGYKFVTCSIDNLGSRKDRAQRKFQSYQKTTVLTRSTVHSLGPRTGSSVYMSPVALGSKS
jgi:hypothetical protein